MAANEFTLEELEALFNEDVQDTPPADDNNTPPATEPTNDSSKLSGKDGAKIVAERINAERKAIAEKLGYTSYEEMLQSQADKAKADKVAKEEALIKDKGYDPNDVKELYEELIKNDPRMQELEKFKQKQVEEYSMKQLSEITKLTGGEITSLDQLPKAVIDEWSRTGNLKSAYLSVEGEKLIYKARNVKSKGTTEHLKSLTGNNTPPPTVRNLTADERQVWKQFHPGITEEELNKKTMPI